MILSPPPGADAVAAERMAAAEAVFVTADDGWDPADVGPADEPAWLADEDDPRADPLAGLDDDQIRAVLYPREGIGAGFSHGHAAASGEHGQGFAAGGPLDVMEPGPELARFAEDAFAAGLGRLSDDELIGFLLAERRLEARHAAIGLLAVAELDRRRSAGQPVSSRQAEHASEELAAALVLTGRSADCLLGLARGLARLRQVLAAMLAGTIDLARARVFAEELAFVGDAQAEEIATETLAVAGSVTTAKLRNLLRRLILLTDADALRERAEAARRDARVECFGEASGNGALAGRELRRADAIAASARITAMARELKDAGLAGSMDEIRAEVFLALLSGRDPADLLAAKPVQAQPSGLSGCVNLIMPIQSWLGDSDAPGEVAGHGPVDADTARELAGPACPLEHPLVRHPGHTGRTGYRARMRALTAAFRSRGRLAGFTPVPRSGIRCLLTLKEDGRLPADRSACPPGPRSPAHLRFPRLPETRHSVRPGPHAALRPGRCDLRM